MTSEVYTVTLDAADPHRLADFWSKLLDYKIVYDSPDEVAIERADGSGPAILFGKSADAKAGKNRMHFDLNPDDQAAEVERALSLGATHVEIGQARDPDVTWKVLADPEGNEFCILTPRKKS
jgi:predicted enzyme related to lactoylglutathione lyase